MGGLLTTLRLPIWSDPRAIRTPKMRCYAQTTFRRDRAVADNHSSFCPKHSFKSPARFWIGAEQCQQGAPRVSFASLPRTSETIAYGEYLKTV